MDSNSFFQQLLLIGVGTTSLITDKLRTVSDQWVKDGQVNPEQAKAMMDDIVTQLRTEASGLDGAVHRQMNQFLEELGVPQQSEMDELRGRLDRLERRLRDLENRMWR